MRSAIGLVLGLTLVGCGSAPLAAPAEYGAVEQPANREPPPAPPCPAPRVLCGVTCVDLERDNANCGDCDERCDVGEGLFCRVFRCVSVQDFGYSLYPRGPRAYDPASDAPRPSAP